MQYMYSVYVYISTCCVDHIQHILIVENITLNQCCICQHVAKYILNVYILIFVLKWHACYFIDSSFLATREPSVALNVLVQCLSEWRKVHHIVKCIHKYVSLWCAFTAGKWTFFVLYESELWPTTLTFELDLHGVKMNQDAKHLHQKSLIGTNTRIIGCTWSTEVVVKWRTSHINGESRH